MGQVFCYVSISFSLTIAALANQHNHLLAIVYRSSISGKTLRIDWQKEMRTIIYSELDQLIWKNQITNSMRICCCSRAVQLA